MRSIQILSKPEEGVCEYSMEVEEGKDLRREIFARLAERNWPLLGMRSSALTLEDVFYRLTKGEEIGGGE